MKRLIAATVMALAAACTGMAGASHPRDGGIIRNSGSTNFSGYTVKVWADGTTWAVHSNRAGTPVDTPQTANVDPRLAKRFLDDARQAKNNRVVSQSCMKSASFGSSTTVEYHGWTSPDLNCPGGGYVVTLGADANKIVAALKLQGEPAHRIRLLPNEPRRAPSDQPSTQASPTPEQTSPAS